MNELREYVVKYYENFSESFPGFYFKGKPPAEIVNIIKKCLKEQKTVDYFYPDEKGVDY